MEKLINEKYAEINELKTLLSNTDYYVIKEAEGDYFPPANIYQSRQNARARINELKGEIELIEAEKVEQELIHIGDDLN